VGTSSFRFVIMQIDRQKNGQTDGEKGLRIPHGKNQSCTTAQRTLA